MSPFEDKIKQAAELIETSKRTSAFTGAGISVESGIPPFRGENGIWNQYDPSLLELGSFLAHPEESWPLIKKFFYDSMGEAQPNPAHKSLAEMERQGFLDCLITQNIDGLHQRAGSSNVHEFHGSVTRFICTGCESRFDTGSLRLDSRPPACRECGHLLKPDFVFFGEAIPEAAIVPSFEETRKSDLFLVIGTTGEVMPANLIPQQAKEFGATIIEINPQASRYTDRYTDLFLQGKASEILIGLKELLK
jgi:NAD-dependent deacetylase